MKKKIHPERNPTKFYQQFEGFGEDVRLARHTFDAVAKGYTFRPSNHNDLIKDVETCVDELERLINVVGQIQKDAAGLVLDAIADPISEFIRIINKTPAINIDNFVKRLDKLLCNVVERFDGPMDSDVLENWNSLYRELLISQHPRVKAVGERFWTHTFHNVTSPVTWPLELRKVVEEAAKEFGFSLPPCAIDDKSEDIATHLYGAVF